MTPSSAGSKSIRLQKFLAAAGVGSRRHCEEIILAGKVCVDGDVVLELGAMVDPDHQKIEVDGTYLKREPKRYYLLNKPAGYLCTNKDPSGRPLVVDLISHEHYRLFPVGRLDENSCGLLLITNDGELANRLAHPRYRITRTYSVQVAGRPSPETLAELRNGLWFTEGLFKVSRIKQTRRKGNSTVLEVDLHEGKNREVRRLFARVGHKVMHLQRIRFGPVRLGKLAMGKYRPLTKLEFDQLKDLLDNPPPAFKKPPRSRGPKKKPAYKITPREADKTSPRGAKSGAKKRGPRKSGETAYGRKKSTQTRPEFDSKPKSKIKSKPKFKAKPNSKDKTKSETDSKFKTKSRTKLKSRPKFKAKSKAQAESDFKKKPKSKPKSRPKQKPKSTSKKSKEKKALNASKKLAKKNKVKKRKK